MSLVARICEFSRTYCVSLVARICEFSRTYCVSLVAHEWENCNANCYCSLFVMNISSILMVPRVVIVVQKYSNDGIDSCKAYNTAILHTL